MISEDTIRETKFILRSELKFYWRRKRMAILLPMIAQFTQKHVRLLIKVLKREHTVKSAILLSSIRKEYREVVMRNKDSPYPINVIYVQLKGWQIIYLIKLVILHAHFVI